jgi:hypothetical protein
MPPWALVGTRVDAGCPLDLRSHARRVTAFLGDVYPECTIGSGRVYGTSRRQSSQDSRADATPDRSLKATRIKENSAWG